MNNSYTCQSINYRIVSFLKFIREPICKAEKKCGFSSGYFKAVANPSADRFDIFIKEYPMVSPHWLKTGEGNMLLSEDNKTKEESNQPEPSVPLLPAVAHGGRLTDFSLAVQRRDCEVVSSPVGNADFAIQVMGDSMEPLIPNGSRLFIKKIDEALFIEWGKVYVVDTPNGVIVKRLMPTDTEGVVECQSENPRYPAFRLDLSKTYGVYRIQAYVKIC